jgi:RNA polymerase sigma factor (sigma-70 family)
LGPHSELSDQDFIKLCQCSDEAEVWDEFVRRYQKSIALSVMRAARQYGETRLHAIEDLCQDTYVKLWKDKFRLLGEFAEKHPEAVIGYIKITAANVAIDHFKALHRLKRPPAEDKQSLGNDDIPGPGGQHAVHTQVLLHQIDARVLECTKGPHQERDQLIFRLHYKLGVSAKDIATLPFVGLTAKGVEVVLARITQMLRERLVEGPKVL